VLTLPLGLDWAMAGTGTIGDKYTLRTCRDRLTLFQADAAGLAQTFRIRSAPRLDGPEHSEKAGSVLCNWIIERGSRRVSSRWVIVQTNCGGRGESHTAKVLVLVSITFIAAVV
jgi:hypothetical protein